MNTYLLILNSEPWIWACLCGVAGLIIGSFLNVVIYRMPLRLEQEWEAECLDYLAHHVSLQKTPSPLPETLKEPPTMPSPEASHLEFPTRSMCTHCHHALHVIDLIPVLSYLMLRGKCRYCKASFSFRYPLIELISAISTALLGILLGPTAAFLWATCLFYILLTLAVIDIDHQLLPDTLTLTALWLGLIHALVAGDIRSSVLGAIIGYGILWTLRAGYWLLTRREGMGLGDAKLLAALGAWCGLSMLPIILLGSSVLGLLCAGPWMLIHGSAKEPIPFGPYLVIAGFGAYLFGPDILNWYWHSWSHLGL